MDMMVRQNTADTLSAERDPSYLDIDQNVRINESEEWMDTATFSIIFSPSGKLVYHGVRVRNRDGRRRPPTIAASADDIFNSLVNINFNNMGMFVQDDYAHYGLGEEWSRRAFILYDKYKMRTAFQTGTAYTQYLQDIENDKIHINPYLGTIITEDKKRP